MKDLPVSEYVLDNGLKVLLCHLDGVTINTVTVNAAVKIGRLSDLERGMDVAHLIEHNLFKGTKKFPTRDLLDGFIERVGGIGGGSTDNELTNYDVEVFPNDLEKAIEYLNEMLFNPLFSEEGFMSSCKMLKEERKKKNDLFRDHFYEFLFGKESPWALSSLAEESKIDLITREQVIDVYRFYYQPKNIVLSVVGNFKKEQALNIIKNYMGVVTNTNINLNISQRPNLDYLNKKVKVTGNDFNRIGLTTGYVFISKDRYREKVLFQIIGQILGLMSSRRTWKKIVGEELLTYSFEIGYLSIGNIDLFRAFSYFDQSNFIKAVDIVFKEFEILKKTLVSEDELSAAKENQKRWVCNDYRDTWMIAKNITSVCAIEGRFNNVEELVAEIDSVTAKDICELVNKYFTKDNFYLFALGGPKKNNLEEEIFALCEKHKIK